MNHKAIYALYANVVSIDDTQGAMDKDGNSVTINMDNVNAWVDPEAYKYKRQLEYPALAEQLDLLYKDMLADKGDKTGDWFAAVKKVKDDNPKP